MKSSIIRKLSILILALVVLFLALSQQIQQVHALIPSVTSVTTFMNGDHTILNITIDHYPSPPLGPDHYVDYIQVEINGTVNTVNQPAPQTTEIFTVQYDLGVVTDTLVIRVLAHCILHGSGDFSSPLTVPEFPIPSLVLTLAFATTLILVLKVRLSRPKTVPDCAETS